MFDNIETDAKVQKNLANSPSSIKRSNGL